MHAYLLNTQCGSSRNGKRGSITNVRLKVKGDYYIKSVKQSDVSKQSATRSRQTTMLIACHSICMGWMPNQQCRSSEGNCLVSPNGPEINRAHVYSCASAKTKCELLCSVWRMSSKSPFVLMLLINSQAPTSTSHSNIGNKLHSTEDQVQTDRINSW